VFSAETEGSAEWGAPARRPGGPAAQRPGGPAARRPRAGTPAGRHTLQRDVVAAAPV